MVDFCMRCKPLIVTYAYGPLFYSNEDMYGLDLIVRLALELKLEFQQAGFVVVIPEITNESYFGTIRAGIKKNGLDPFFCFAVGNHFSFIPFLKYADLFIRATNTDGDALTLREALYYGVPSVASDVCIRPEGTVLFQNRNIKELSRAARSVLNNNTKKQHIVEAQRVNNAELFINIFKRTAGLEN